MEENLKSPLISLDVRKRIGIALAAAALFGSGLAVGMVIRHGPRPVIVAPRVVTPLQRLATPGSFLPAEVVTVKGKVVEKFDDFVILEDASGKAGFQLGRRGGLTDRVTLGETIGFQGLIGPRGMEPSFVILPGNRIVGLRGRQGGGEHRHRQKH